MDLLIPSWVTSITAVVVAVVALVKTVGDKSKSADDKTQKADTTRTQLTLELESIKDKLDNPDTGLGAIKKDTAQMQLHCAKTSTAIVEQIKVHDREIGQLRRRISKEDIS